MALSPDISALADAALSTEPVTASSGNLAKQTTQNAYFDADIISDIDSEASATASVVSGSVAEAISDRLPTTVTPTHYDIYLHPDIDSGIVTGSVTIDAIINEPTSVITLHAKAITIDKVMLRKSDRQEQQLCTTDAHAIEYTEHMETATIHLRAELPPSNVQIVIDFTNRLSESMYGMYRSKYKDRGGRWASMIVTQFQAKCARMAFPCWDEPAIKAEFSLAITVPASHTALSNMPVQRTTPGTTAAKSTPGLSRESNTCDKGTLKTVYFARSPRMSTYLLAIVSGELDFVEGVSMSGPLRANGKHSPVACRVYTAAADVDKVQFSLDTTLRVLERLVDMFGVAYPLPKLDLVAVPELEAGGMENWGLVLFRTVRLFITKRTSLWIRQKAVYVIVHELSHQWFGNLVTMAWWDDLWLNEGFATWIGIHITDQMYPEWKRWCHFAIEDRQAALSADSLRSSHAIQVAIKGTADIDQVFDSITYYKGCALIRMLSAHLGIDAFMAGVRHYLAAHQYDTATTQDLWLALESASGEQVSAMMHSWTTQVGYPMIAVDIDFDAGFMLLRQNRYLHSGDCSPEEDCVVWWVPLALASSTTGTQPANVKNKTMQSREARMPVPGGSAAAWVKLNCSNIGLYRVCYSPGALVRLAAAITRSELGAVDVIGILNDTVALVVSGYMRTSVLLDMIDTFQAASEHIVWQIIGSFLERMYLTWAEQDEPARLQICELSRSLFGPKAVSLGWISRAGDGPLDARLRAVSIPKAGWAGHPAVVEQACCLFSEFYAQPKAKWFEHDFTSTVFEIAVRSGPPANYRCVRDMYEHSERWRLSEDHRMAALCAMACSTDKTQILGTLEYVLTDSVLPQDMHIVFGCMATSDHCSKHVLWRWFCQNYQRVVDRLGDCSTLLGHVVSTVIGDYATEHMAALIERWFADKPTAAFDRTLPQSLEFIRVRAAWYTRDQSDVRQWFEKRSRPGAMPWPGSLAEGAAAAMATAMAMSKASEAGESSCCK
ncbi:hypothetical protein LPJ66_007045 [Kickxella alabastrina]|uniref:Uncharacterized protein n=1 Tax=Kickxella alabastrina TaxID=61397 RepID=A0ACC1IIA1_9FUNG|nr:hypothetical protein LPJ66_007045 [Kickxella alabastrina]